jgi:hypothetical protein
MVAIVPRRCAQQCLVTLLARSSSVVHTSLCSPPLLVAYTLYYTLSYYTHTLKYKGAELLTPPLLVAYTLYYTLSYYTHTLKYKGAELLTERDGDTS